MNTQVDILLACYNGANYLQEQLSSIERQTHERWRLILGDDGSSDDSISILKSFIQRYPGRCKLFLNGRGGGAAQHFSRLMGHSDAPYVMFCDQDDVWDANKVEITLNKAIEIESKRGSALPLLIHTDVRVVDAALGVITPSFWRYTRLQPERYTDFNHFIVQNSVTGCAALCNRALVDMAQPLPPAAIMHDWWLALVASAFGSVIPLAAATLAYRQHGANVLGAQRFSPVKQFLNAWHRRHHPIRQRQAYAFLERYGLQLDEERREILKVYLALPQRGFFLRRYLPLQYGLRRHGFLRQLCDFVMGWI